MRENDRLAISSAVAPSLNVTNLNDMYKVFSIVEGLESYSLVKGSVKSG